MLMELNLKVLLYSCRALDEALVLEYTITYMTNM